MSQIRFVYKNTYYRVSDFNKQALEMKNKFNNPMLSIAVNVENVSVEVSPELIRDLFSFTTQYLLHYNVEVYHQFRPNNRPNNKENISLKYNLYIL